jgi:hypothetical protein
MSTTKCKTSPILIAAAWLVVSVPLGWGVYQSLVKSLPLFGVSASPEPPSRG